MGSRVRHNWETLLSLSMSFFVSFTVFDLQAILFFPNFGFCLHEISSPFFHFQSMYTLDQPWVSYRHIVGSRLFLVFNPFNLFPLTGEINPFTFKVIIDGEELTTDILKIVFWKSYNFLSLLSSLTTFLCGSLTSYSEIFFVVVVVSSLSLVQFLWPHGL